MRSFASLRGKAEKIMRKSITGRRMRHKYRVVSDMASTCDGVAAYKIRV